MARTAAWLVPSTRCTHGHARLEFLNGRKEGGFQTSLLPVVHLEKFSLIFKFLIRVNLLHP